MPHLKRTPEESVDPSVKILLVDDDPANLLAVLEAILSGLSATVVKAHSGEAALLQILEHDFAVVLVDVRMEGMDGFETVKLIRGRGRSRHTPIIFLTAFETDFSRLEQAYALGAVDYLVKPLVPAILRAKVAVFVDLFQKTEEARRQSEQLRLLVHRTTEYAIFMLDKDGRVVSWNLGAQRIKGYRAEEIIGQHFSRFYPPESIDRGLPEHGLRTARSEGRFEGEGWRVRKDGSRFWANVVITALYDDAGVLRGFSKITRDMTELKRAEENARRLLIEEAARKAADDLAETIRDQHEQLLVTVHSIGDGVIATDAQGRITLLNSIAESLTGWTVEDARHQPLKTVFRIVNEFTREEIENPVDQVLREGTVVRLANRTVLISRQGLERPIDDSAAPIKDSQGNVIGVVLVFRDGTEDRARERRRATRLAVTHILAEASTIAEAAPGILRAFCENLGWRVGGLWIVDPAAKRLRCISLWHNPSLTSGQIERFETMTRNSLFPPGVGLPGCVWASKQPTWVADITQGTGFPRAAVAAQAGLQSAFGFPIMASDAVIGVVDFFSSAEDVRQPDADLLEMVRSIGALIGQFVERKQVENEVRHKAQTLGFLADASAALAGLVDYRSTLQKVAGLCVPFFADWCAIDTLEPDGSLRRLAVSHRAASRVSLAHELHRYPQDPPTPSAPLQGVWNILRTGEPEFISDIPDSLRAETSQDAGGVEQLRTLGESGVKSYIGAPLKVREKTLGVITFIMAESGRQYDTNDLSVATDLAHRAAQAIENARLYHEVKETDRRKDEFLATLAHELRNPLAPIKNSVQIMQMRGLKDPHLQWASDVIGRQVEQMARLVDDLLDISRISRGKITLRKQSVDLIDMVHRAVETTRPLLDERQHQLTLNLPSEAIRVDGDPTRLEQIFANLLNNSAKYTEPGGRISVTLQRENGTAILRVRDNGIGISPELLPHVFDMFVQAEHGHDRAKGGLGIGLCLVRNLLEMHAGSITAQSEGMGKGSEFTVRLPTITDRPELKGRQVLRKKDESPRVATRRILVVDDNVDAAESLALLLRLEGHDVQVVHDGQAALQAVQTHQPELIFLDIGLPGMNGYDVARRIRKLPGGEQMMLFALTGWGQQDDRRQSREAGFDEHLVKPVHHSMLATLLSSISPAGNGDGVG